MGHRVVKWEVRRLEAENAIEAFQWPPHIQVVDHLMITDGSVQEVDLPALQATIGELLTHRRLLEFERSKVQPLPLEENESGNGRSS